MKKYCPKCENKIKGSPKFCPECGHDLLKVQEKKLEAKKKTSDKKPKKEIKNKTKPTKEPIKLHVLDGRRKWGAGAIAICLILSTILVYGYYTDNLPNFFAEPIIDSDRDGYNDVVDAFPNNPSEWKDSDNDGVGDNTDYYPYDSTKWEKSEVSHDDEVEPGDTDGDNLSDDYELQIGTDPNDTNTDGDRYSDYMEATGVGMPSYVKGKGASPLYPAVPVLQIKPSTSFDIILAKEITTSVGNIITKTRTIESGFQETTNSITGGYLEVGVGGGNIISSLLCGGLPFSIKAGVYHTNQHTTNIYSYEKNTLATQEQWYRAEHIDLPDSYIMVPITIKNIGTDILQSEIDDIVVNLFIGDDTRPSLETWHLNRDEYRICNLEPDKSSVEITAKFYGLTTDKLKRIDMGESIRVVIAHCSYGEDELFLLDAVNRVIKVTIDNGTSVIYDYVRPEEANTFVEIISSITDIVVKNGEIERVGSLSKTANSGWMVLVPTNEDIDTDSELLNAVFTAGDEIVLVYLRDSDGDNIIDREERLLGLNTSNQDTDDDNLNDYDEIFSDTNPLLPDTDFDGLLDGEEIQYGSDGYITNPTVNDTDNDGLSDGIEVNNYGTNPTKNDSDSDGIFDKKEIYWRNLGFGNFDPTVYNLPVLILVPIADTYINQEKPNQNFGGYPYMVVRNVCGDYKRTSAMIKFDLSIIPERTTILSSNLKLYYYAWEEANPANRILNVYRMMGDWDEYEVKWPGRPDNSITFSSKKVPVSTNSWMIWNVTNDSQDFVVENEANFGWKIVDNEEDLGWGDCPKAMFRTRDYTNSNVHPYLEIKIIP